MALTANPAQRKSRDIGRLAEQLALHYLQSRGLKLVTRNFHCRFGEIDLILTERDILVFTEVRYRKQQTFGSGAESVDARKQQKLQASAAYFLQRHPAFSRHPCRFDVVALHGTTLDEQHIDFNWITDAFQAG